jgi:hypothetical protein
MNVNLKTNGPGPPELQVSQEVSAWFMQPGSRHFGYFPIWRQIGLANQPQYGALDKMRRLLQSNLQADHIDWQLFPRTHSTSGSQSRSFAHEYRSLKNGNKD